MYKFIKLVMDISLSVVFDENLHRVGISTRSDLIGIRKKFLKFFFFFQKYEISNGYNIHILNKTHCEQVESSTM